MLHWLNARRWIYVNTKAWKSNGLSYASIESTMGAEITELSSDPFSSEKLSKFYKRKINKYFCTRNVNYRVRQISEPH